MIQCNSKDIIKDVISTVKRMGQNFSQSDIDYIFERNAHVTSIENMLRKGNLIFQCRFCSNREDSLTFRNIIENPSSVNLCRNCRKHPSITRQVESLEHFLNIIENRTMYEIACVLNITRETLRKFLKKFGMEGITYEVSNKRRNTSLKNTLKERGKEIVEMRQRSMLNKYGDKNYNVKRTIESIKEKYGVEHLHQIPNIDEKRKQTNLKKYGVEYTFQAESVKDNIKKTNLLRYGVENPQQCKSIQEKAQRINLERYGMRHPLVSDASLKKSKQRIKELYGADNPGILNRTYQSKEEEYVFSLIKHLDILHNDGKLSNKPFCIKGYSKTLGRFKVKFPDYYNKKLKIIGEYNGSYFHQSKTEIDVWNELFSSLGYRCFIIWDFEVKKLKENPPKTLEELLHRFPCSYRTKEQQDDVISRTMHESM